MTHLVSVKDVHAADLAGLQIRPVSSSTDRRKKVLDSVTLLRYTSGMLHNWV
ncbi:MAG: hypothetical protein OJF62_003114 [Pseudolabrys sp.]|jgi:hypothetical protein|nr:hypothetical protein [Pseudolabrys sp.]